MPESRPDREEDSTGPMSGLTFSVVAPTLGLLLVLGLLAWRQCTSPPQAEPRLNEPASSQVVPQPTRGFGE
jgi:hypothetical protein